MPISPFKSISVDLCIFKFCYWVYTHLEVLGILLQWYFQSYVIFIFIAIAVVGIFFSTTEMALYHLLVCVLSHGKSRILTAPKLLGDLPIFTLFLTLCSSVGIFLLIYLQVYWDFFLCLVSSFLITSKNEWFISDIIVFPHLVFHLVFI